MEPAHVSRETLDRLKIYERLLRKWNPRINLVAPDSLSHVGERHFRDSMQLLSFAPEGWKAWVDLGSGGGFPGMVVAIANPDKEVILIEADSRKAGFLRTVARETGVDPRIIVERIETVPPLAADVVSARALAPLPRLLAYVNRHLAPDGVALLPKGRNASQEIETALADWRFDCETKASRVDPDSVILKLGGLQRA